MEKFAYNTSQYPFANIVGQIFNTNNLSQLHTIVSASNDIPEDPSQDQKTSYHKIFYAAYEDPTNTFLDLYRDFVSYLRGTHFPSNSVIYQSRPTFRVHAPENIAVAKWHKDKAYNHSSNEINIFLPLTSAFDTNTIWAESEEDKGDYAPMNAHYGEYYIWNGANLLHGNKKNETGVSRVSLDFRFIFPENFNYSGSSVTHNVEMSLGKYWTKLD